MAETACKKYERGAFTDSKIEFDTTYSSVLKNGNIYVFPGFVDVHVHTREPGFSYKEDLESVTKAAAHGGYTDILAMPNLNPMPDTPLNLELQLKLIKEKAQIRVHPYGTITRGENGEELVDYAALKNLGAVAFSDDGKGVQNSEITRRAMLEIKKSGLIFAAHCEDETLLCKGGSINDCAYAKLNKHIGISKESEWKMVERDLNLAKETGVKYHVCHVSTAESVELIRKAKAEGVDVTCETAPHYLTLDDSFLKEDGAYKMNPPLRSSCDRLALIKGIQDGTIDMIATDHAPHSVDEKNLGLDGSKFGIVGLETAFPILYTKLVKTGIITLTRLVELMSVNPRKRFDIKSDINEDYCAFDLSAEYNIRAEDFLSKGKSSPFIGEKVYGRCIKTVVNGGTKWKS